MQLEDIKNISIIGTGTMGHTRRDYKDFIKGRSHIGCDSIIKLLLE
jgi:hypothetical protein